MNYFLVYCTMYEEQFKQLKLDMDILSKSANTKEYRNYTKSLITKELMEELLPKYSLYHICTEILQPKGFKLTASSLKDRCIRMDLKTLSIKEQANRKEVRNKYIKTCLEKYGSNNCLSKGTTIYKKRNKVVKESRAVQPAF